MASILFSVTKDHKLYVSIKEGKILDYSATDLEGKALGIKISPPIRGMSACVECVPIPCPAALLQVRHVNRARP